MKASKMPNRGGERSEATIIPVIAEAGVVDRPLVVAKWVGVAGGPDRQQIVALFGQAVAETIIINHS